MEYPWEIRNEKIGNLNLRILGVRHTPEFFKKYKEYLSHEVQKSGHLFFEDGCLNSDGFYRSLTDFIKGDERSIYVPDSANFGHMISDLVLLGVGYKLFRKSLKGSFSRRNLLKKGCGILGGLYLGTGFIGLREDALQSVVGSQGTLDNLIAYDAIQDFRNIISANNFHRVERDLGIKGNATYFIGGAHVNGLSAYINNVNLLKKRILYLPQELITNDRIKEYQHDGKKWKIIREV